MKNIDHIVELMKEENNQEKGREHRKAYRQRALKEMEEKGYYTVCALDNQENEYPFAVTLHQPSQFSKSMPHNHDFFELVYVYRGCCTNICNGIETILEEDDLLLMNPNAIHSIRVTSEKSAVFNLLISKELFRQSFFSLVSDNLLSNFIINYFYQVNKSADFMIVTKDSTSPVYAILQGMIEEYYMKELGFDRILEAGITQVFLYMARIVAKQFSYEMPSSMFMNSILLYIYRNYATVTLKEVAATFGYSEKYISREMKKELNSGFTQITRELRLSHAAQYLAKTTMPIGQVAQKVGYQNVSHFYTLFHEKYGQSPMEYRQSTNRDGGYAPTVCP